MSEPRRRRVPDEPAAELKPHLRVVGVICDRCGHEDPADDARLHGWHVSSGGEQVVCRSCVELYALDLDDVVLTWPACGHLTEYDVLYVGSACPTCEG
jgi:hypothetical protein